MFVESNNEEENTNGDTNGDTNGGNAAEEISDTLQGTIQLVNFADKYFAIFQFFPILRIKCLRLFTRERHCACAEPRFVQKIKFYAN